MNHQDVVDAVKATLVAKGVDLSGPCGAFAITQRVAALLAPEGVGCLAKPAGNQCDGFSVDCVVYRDGRLFDILVDAGGANAPAWNANGTVDPSRWRPSPFLASSPAPVPTPGPSVDPSERERLLVEIRESLMTVHSKLNALAQQADANTAKIQQQIDQAIHNAEKSAAPLLLRIFSLGLKK